MVRVREGYARLRITLDRERSGTARVRIWFIEPLPETPEELKRKWEELEREEDEPAWLVVDTVVRARSKWVKVRYGRVRYKIYVEGGVLEKVLPKGFYAVEIGGRRRGAVVFCIPLYRDAEVPVTLPEEGVDDWGVIHP